MFTFHLDDPEHKGKFKTRTPGGVKGTGLKLRNEKRQERSLNAIDHGFKPT
jgi:hypothetical protein